MPRYFAEFVNPETDESIVVTFKLFSNSLPKTTSNIADHFFSEASKKSVSYRKSKVTRVIAPEYLIQFGYPERKSKETIKNIQTLIDTTEFSNVGEKYNDKLKGRLGLLCIAEKPRALDYNTTHSIELCVLFVPWEKYQELDGYVVVGECKEWNSLKNWMSKVDVTQNEIGSWEIPTGDGIWINRCGKLQESESKETKSESTDPKQTKRKSGKIKALDLLFKNKKPHKK